MSNGYAAEVPAHVEMAAIDEDVREMAVDGSWRALEAYCSQDGFGRFMLPTYPSARSRLETPLRVLRHFGLLVEHGDGVVSVKETP